METICFPFKDFDFVVDPFESAGTDRVIGMIQDPIGKEPQLLDERPDGRMIDLAGHPPKE